MKTVFATWGWRPVPWDSSQIAVVLSLQWHWMQGLRWLQFKKPMHVGRVQLPSCRLLDHLCSTRWNVFAQGVHKSLQLNQGGTSGRVRAGLLHVAWPTRSWTAVMWWLAAVCCFLGGKKSLFSLLPGRSDQPWDVTQENPLKSELLPVHSKICSPLNFLLPKKSKATRTWQ